MVKFLWPAAAWTKYIQHNCTLCTGLSSRQSIDFFFLLSPSFLLGSLFFFSSALFSLLHSLAKVLDRLLSLPSFSLPLAWVALKWKNSNKSEIQLQQLKWCSSYWLGKPGCQPTGLLVICRSCWHCWSKKRRWRFGKEAFWSLIYCVHLLQDTTVAFQCGRDSAEGMLVEIGDECSKTVWSSTSHIVQYTAHLKSYWIFI